jgi:Ser/Thr protein kinase RdoA (MazF antagonist)
MIELLSEIVGSPVELEELKHKPNRRRTVRARGPLTTAIVKQYSSDRATVVARRVSALAGGPTEPLVPSVLHFDPELHTVVLSDIPGRPLREALLLGELGACRRAGAALGAWHTAWTGAAPSGLSEHTAAREIDIISLLLEETSPVVARAVSDALPVLSGAWRCTTVVHRDLYEEQIMIGELVGLIDLDDAALGPPELDMGNLVAHLELLERRRRVSLNAVTRALFDGYEKTGPALDRPLLNRCRALALLRLACLNDDLRLARAALFDRIWIKERAVR